jgi:Beta-lactamase
MDEADLTALLREHAVRHAVPGAAIGVFRDGTAMTACYGVADITTGEPITSGTRFSAGSLTKSMVATVIAALAEAGRLSLDDLVAGHVPELPASGWAGRATVRDLLANRSGLPLRAGLEFGFADRKGQDDGALSRLVADAAVEGPGSTGAAARRGGGMAWSAASGHAQVIYLDLRGHGRSAWGDATAWRFETCADDVRVFCDTAGIARRVVIVFLTAGDLLRPRRDHLGRQAPGRAAAACLGSVHGPPGPARPKGRGPRDGPGHPSLPSLPLRKQADHRPDRCVPATGTSPGHETKVHLR